MNKKAVLVAKDALAQLKSGKIIPENVYCHIGVRLEYPIRGSYVNIKDLFDDNQVEFCEACAKGALFISYISKYNNFHADVDISNNISVYDESICETLRNIFSETDLDMIELCYEGVPTNVSQSEIYDTREEDISNYYFKYENELQRMKAIFQNIIDNNGTFVLPSSRENKT